MSRKLTKLGQTCALALVAAIGSGCGDDASTAKPPHGDAEPAHACAGGLNATTTTSFYEAARCLFEGTDPPQAGVDAGTIERGRVAIVRGSVQERDGSSLADVRVTVAHHPEYGETVTDKDGQYALAVNGGEALTLRFEKDDYLTSQRRRLTEWQQFSAFPAVSLLPASKAVSAVNLKAAQKPVLAASDINKDADGERQQVVLIRPGTTVTLDLPDGTRQNLDQFHLRATEYTVGAAGPSAMPGELPVASGYTYATEFSLDEARDAEATRVEFDPPLVSYVDNFLSFPAGTSVPAGYYDPDQDQWQPAQDGVVLDVVTVEKGKAALDVDGDGEADDEATLSTLGIDVTELEALGSRYRAGASIWRVPLAHFSAWDYNWGFGPPADAEAPDMDVEASGALDCKTSVSGSIIGCEDQTLGEAIPVAGTPFTLHYQSERTPGRIDSHDLAIRLSGAKVPKSLKRIDVEVEVLGKVTRETFEPKPNQSYNFHWDGKDPWGRVWQGRQVAKVRVGYSYDGAYERTPGFGAPGSGVAITASRTRQDVTLWKEWRGNVGSLSAEPLGLGGWTLDAQHLYDPRGRVLYLGNGAQRTAEGLGTFVTTVAGTGKEGSSGDGGPALDATLAQPHGIVVAPDGTAFFADDLHHVIRRIAPDGTIETIAGTGEADFSGDGGLATAAALNKPMGLALGRDGTLYVADGSNHRVRTISPKGRIRTIAGGGETEVDVHGVPALEAAFLEPHALALSNDGDLYMADNTGNAVYRLGTDGLITRLAGGGATAKNGEPADHVALQSPLGLSLGASGELYIAEFDGNRISKIDASGRFWIVAGTGAPGFSGDRGPAVLAELNNPHTVDVGSDGSLYVTDEGNRRVRRITPDGYIDTVAGSGKALVGEESGDNGPPLAARFSQPRVVYVHKDGSLWIADYTDARIRRIRPALPGFVNGETVLASSTGTELFAFDSFGRHLHTLDAVTGVPLLSFEYDSEGRLTGVRDREGSLTALSRDKEGTPEAIVGPYGQRTELAIGPDGYLKSITNAAGEQRSFTYKDGGLLATMVDPENPAENVHRFEYDGFGRLLQDTSPGGLVQSLERMGSDQGFSVSLTTGMGRNRTHEVNALGDGASRRIVTLPDGTSTTTDLMPGRRSTTFPNGSTIETTLNGDTRFGMQAPFAGEVKIAQGILSPMTIATRRVAELKDASDPLSLTSLTETTNVNGRAFTSVWDGRTRTRTTTSPEGRRYVETLDKLGHVVTTQLGALEPTELEYDSFGRVIALTSASRVAKLGFDDAGNLAKSVDPLRQSTKFGYDAVGRLTQTTLADSQPIAFAYDANFNLISVAPPGKEEHGFAFGLGDLLTAYAPPALGKADVATRYEYNGDQQLVSVTRPGEGALELNLEKSTGQLTSINFPEGSVSLEYDPKTGQMSSATREQTRVSYTYEGDLPTRTTWAGDVAGTVARSYDKNFWVISEQVSDHPAVSFAYDKDGLLTAAGSETLTRDAAQGFVTDTKLSSVTDSMSYSRVAEPSAYSASASGKELLAQVFERDALGRVTQVTETTAGATHTIEYAYYPRGWLRSVTRDGAEEQSFEYDENGNRTTIKLAGKATSAEFDAQDRLISQGDVRFDYSLNGELATKDDAAGTTRYSYDALGNLLSVEQPTVARIDYVIDPAGRRIGKKLDGKLTKGFLYRSALQPVAEVDGSGNITSVFVYASRPNVPDYLIRGTTTYRIISDLRGSPRFVVNAATGAIAQQLDYDAWGQVTADTSPGFQPFGFAGGLYDADTGLVRFGARDYDPSVGRWVSRDPILFGGGQANLFLYVENDPINLTDPSGLMLPVIAASAAIGAATGFVGNALVQVAQKGWGCVDWGDAAISGGVGAIQGALAPLGGGLGAATLVGAGGGWLQYVATESSHGRELHGDRAWAAVLLGGLGGGLGKALSPAGSGGLGYWEGRAIGGLDQTAVSTLNGTGVATATSIRAVGASLASSTVSNLPGAD